MISPHNFQLYISLSGPVLTLIFSQEAREDLQVVLVLCRSAAASCARTRQSPGFNQVIRINTTVLAVNASYRGDCCK